MKWLTGNCKFIRSKTLPLNLWMNRRMVEAGRDVWSPVQGPCSISATWSLVAQDQVQRAFEYFQGGRPVFILCLDKTSCVSVCAPCTSSCHWILLKRAWLGEPAHLARTSSGSLSVTGECWKPYWRLDRQYPLLSPNLPNQSFHNRTISGWSSLISPW